MVSCILRICEYHETIPGQRLAIVDGSYSPGEVGYLRHWSCPAGFILEYRSMPKGKGGGFN